METFGTERLTGALHDRLPRHVNILEMNGESSRLAQSRAAFYNTSWDTNPKHRAPTRQ
jgi:hypothetical protein